MINITFMMEKKLIGKREMRKKKERTKLIDRLGLYKWFSSACDDLISILKGLATVHSKEYVPLVLQS